MPLFKCEQCGVVENTALSNYWDSLLEKKPKLCSQCDPDIGEWHGQFPRTLAADWPHPILETDDPNLRDARKSPA